MNVLVRHQYVFITHFLTCEYKNTKKYSYYETITPFYDHKIICMNIL